MLSKNLNSRTAAALRANFLRNAINPASAEPNRAKVAGSGAAV